MSVMYHADKSVTANATRRQVTSDCQQFSARWILALRQAGLIASYSPTQFAVIKFPSSKQAKSTRRHSWRARTKIDACGNRDKLNRNKIQLPTKWELTCISKAPVTPLKTNTETEQTDAVTPSLRSGLRSLHTTPTRWHFRKFARNNGKFIFVFTLHDSNITLTPHETATVIGDVARQIRNTKYSKYTEFAFSCTQITTCPERQTPSCNITPHCRKKILHKSPSWLYENDRQNCFFFLPI